MSSKQSLITKIKKYPTYRALIVYKEELLANGLSLQETIDGRFVLCRIQDGVPVHDELLDDYIYAGNIRNLDEQINPLNLSLITEFIRTKASTNTIEDLRKYNQNIALYGKPVRVYNEHDQNILAISRTIID